MTDSEVLGGHLDALRSEVADLRLVNDKQDALQKQLQKSLAQLLKQMYNNPDDAALAVRRSHASVNSSKTRLLPHKQGARPGSGKSRADSSLTRRKNQKSNPR